MNERVPASEVTRLTDLVEGEIWPSYALDKWVFAEKESEARELNHRGYREQIEYLVSQLGVDEVEQVLMDWIANPSGTAVAVDGALG